MRKYLILAALLPLLGACMGTTDAMAILDEATTTAGKVSDETLKAAQKSIDAYCMTVPEPYRLKLRQAINDGTEKGDVYIECQ